MRRSIWLLSLIGPLAVYACSESQGADPADATAEAGVDGGGATDGSTTDSPANSDASSDATEDVECPADAQADPDAAETCIAFGKGKPCHAACGLGEYGYRCYGGQPEGVAGCLRVTHSLILDNTYCCSELKCVRTPPLDTSCDGGTPKMMQCPNDNKGGPPIATPPTGCQASTGPGPYAYFCCP